LDSGFDLGGEDGCSDGGAVKLCEGRGCKDVRLAFGLAVVLIISVSLDACTRSNAPSAPDAAGLLQNIPLADSTKYPSLQENKHWSNPYLVIRPDAVGLLSGVAANEEEMLKPADVVNELAHLPAAAWPYGRAVAILVDEKPTSPEQDKVALRRNRGIVQGDLDGAHVAIRWIATP
jgi:hypothetical protein